MNSKRVLGGRVKIALPDTDPVTKIPVAPLIAENRAAVEGVYTDAVCATAYVSGAVQGGTLYFKLSEARTFNVGAKVSAWDTSDEAAPNLTAMTVVKSVTTGGVTTVEVVLMEDDAAPYLDGADYLFHSDTVFTGVLIHAWCHSGATITELGLFQKLDTGIYSPDLIGTEAAWATLEAGDMSPSTSKLLIDAELYVDSNCTNGTILELVIDPWIKGHRL